MSRAIENLLIFKQLKEKNEDYANKIVRLYDATEVCLNQIGVNGLFEGFTDHSMLHSIKIIEYMQQLMHLDKKNKDKFSARDLYYAIAVALLHDIGMVIGKDERDKYLNGENDDKNFDVNQIFAFQSSKDIEREKKAYLAVYIRKNHGVRSANYILNDFNNIRQIIGDFKDANNIANICQSHCMSFESAISKFKNMKNKFEQLGQGEVASCRYIALLLRLADAFDISETRAPNSVRNIRAINKREENKIHWDMNFAIDEVLLMHKLDYFDAPNADSLKVQVKIKDFETFMQRMSVENKKETISKADYYEIQSDVFQYFSMVEKELITAKTQSIEIAFNNGVHEDYPHYFLDISTHISFDPEPTYESHIVNMNYKSVLVNLLGNGLYEDSRIGLREIVQNSIDAIKWKNTVSSSTESDETNKIIITIDAKKDYVSIADNGIGMDKSTITECLLGIGKSIYNTESFRISNNQFQHIGYYGIGFFSIFMLCDSVTINSKKDDGPITSVTINATNPNFFSEIVDSPTKFFTQRTSGTEIVLHGIDKFKKAFNYLQIEDQPDTSEQCYGEAVQHYLELLFLNDTQCNIKFVIKEFLDHEPSSKIDGIDDNIFNKICDIQSLNIDNKYYSRKDNIVETLIEYTDISYSALYQWDGTKFQKITDWQYLDIKDGEPIEICALADWDSNSLIMLYIPRKYKADPFELGVNNFRQRVFYDSSPLAGSYTLNHLIADTGKQLLIKGKNYCISTIEKMYFKRFLNRTILYKINSYFEAASPLSAIKSGREYLDKLYVRNVLVPESHLCLPLVFVGINNKFNKEIKKIIINVLSKNVVPNIKRDDLDDKNLKITSKIVAELLIEYTDISEEEKEYFKKLLEEQL